MIPIIIGAAVAAGAAYALSNDDKKDGTWHEEITRRTIPESEVPEWARRQLNPKIGDTYTDKNGVEHTVVSDDYVRKLMKKHNRKVRRG